MKRIAFAVLLVAALLMSPSSWAQTGSAEPDDNHFSFNRVGDGYLRLDQRNGEISHCNHGTTGWICELVPDDRQAIDAEVAHLRSENVALKKELLDHGLSLPNGVDGNVAALGNGDQQATSPRAGRVERVKLLVGKMWQRLVDMIVNLKQGLLKQETSKKT
jgi:hypothetical protein